MFRQADDETEVMVAGDPERRHMALCDKLGGIPYQKKQLEYAVKVLFYFTADTFHMIPTCSRITGLETSAFLMGYI